MLHFRSIIALCAILAIVLGLNQHAPGGAAFAAGSGGLNPNGTRMATPRPTPKPKPTPEPRAITAPSNLRPVQGKHGCAQALSLLAVLCDSNLKAGNLMLIWNDPASKLDGYKVYRVGGGRHLTQTLSNGPSPKFVAINRPSGGYDHTCYAVSAYRGKRESALSGSYCVQPGATASTATFTPAHVRSYVVYVDPQILDPNNQNGTQSLASLLTKTQPRGFNTLIPSQLIAHGRSTSISGTAYVGYQDAYVTQTAPGGFFGGYDHGFIKINSRAGMDFNLRKLANHKIYSAILTLDVSQTLRDYNNHNQFRTSDYSCIDHYWVGKDFWWTYSGPLNNVAAGANLQAGPGPTVSFDMTKPVADWAAAGDQSDYGFVFSNLLADARAAQPAAQNLACFSRYYTAQLKVVYF